MIKRLRIALGLILLFFLFLPFCSGGALAFEEKGWNQEKSTHFIVYYKDADEKFVRQTSEKAEEYYASIADELGFTRYDFWLWDKRAKIYIYNNAEDYQSNTGKPAWSGGVAYYHEKVIETFPWAMGFFDSLLPHELGHIIFREFVGGQSNAPQWLDEGVAMYQEKRRRLIEVKSELLTAIENKKIIPLEQLSTLNVAFIGDTDKVKIFYLEAFSVVDYLIKEFGKDNFVEFCRALRERKPFNEAINDGYRVFKNLEELNKAWIRYLKD